MLNDLCKPRNSQRSEYFLIKNSLLPALSASALKTVADPSFGGSAVRYPKPFSRQRRLQTFLSTDRDTLLPDEDHGFRLSLRSSGRSKNVSLFLGFADLSYIAYDIQRKVASEFPLK